VPGRLRFAGCLVVIPPLILALVPVAMLLLGSFRDSPPGAAGHWTFANYAALFSNVRVVAVVLNTAWVALFATTLAILAGCGMAWLVTRTDIPGRRLLEALGIVPFLTPGIVTAIGWGILANPDNGLLNLAWRALTHTTLSPLNIYSYLGVAFVLAFPASGFAYLMMLGPMRNLSSSFGEAARLSGAGALRTFRSIHLPLLWPALAPIAMLAFLRAIEAFEVPVILGTPAGVIVLINYVYQLLKIDTPPRYGLALALSVVVGGIAISAIALQAREADLQSGVSITGKEQQTTPIALGPWALPSLVLIWGYLAVAVLLPLGTIAATAFMHYSGVFSLAAVTFDNFGGIFHDAATLRAIANTLILVVVCSTLSAVIGGAAGYVLQTKRVPFPWLIEAAILVPWALPGLIFGLAALWTYIYIPGAYGTLAGLIVAYITLGVPIAMRSLRSVLRQIGTELEEAARVHGAGLATTLRRIVVPLVLPGMIGAWFTLAAIFSRELAATVMLYGFGSETVSVQLLSYWDQGRGTYVAALSVMLVLFLFALYAAQQVLVRRYRIGIAP
jgi:iron(III) transport system permease protein